MLELQATMNSKVDPDWINAKYPYLRAVAIEGAEAIEHHGWKWWKKQQKDLAQLQMELLEGFSKLSKSDRDQTIDFLKKID